MSAVMRLDLTFFAYSAGDLRRGFRRAANQVRRQGPGSGRPRVALVETTAPLVLLDNAAGGPLDMVSTLWSRGAPAELSMVRAQFLYSTLDGLIGLLRGNPGGSYLDLDRDDPLPAYCNGEFRAKPGDYGTGEWESRWVQMPL